MQSAKVIVNPVAGRGSARHLIEPIRAWLKQRALDAELILTRAPWHAVELAHRAHTDGVPLVVAAGGDGTIHEVVNGLAEAASGAQPATLGIIPIGTGNDFVKTAGIPTDWRAACEIISRGVTRCIDLGRMNERWFVNNAGIGFDAQVGIESESVRWARGKSVYILALARTMLMSYRTPRVSIEIDGEVRAQRITLVNVGNGRCEGGGFWLTPDASPYDGLLDVCIADELSRARMLALIPHVMRGTHVNKPRITMSRARRIVVTSEEPLPVQTDGELYSRQANRVSFEAVARKLNVCVK